MKKQVATILGNMAYEIKQCDCKDPALGLLIKQATQQICQLFEPKPMGTMIDKKDKIEELICSLSTNMGSPWCKDCGMDAGCGKSIHSVAHKICQLLGDDKEKELMFNPDWTPDIQAMLKEFNESVETIKLECQAKLEQTVKDDADRCAGYLKLAREECQERVDKIFREIEEIIALATDSLVYCEEHYGHDDMARLNVEAGWQALKKKALG